MSEKVIEVHHGTAQGIIGKRVLNGKAPLIGRRDLGAPSLSGTLTNEFDYAASLAYRRGIKPLVLTYHIPQALLRDEGLIAMAENAHGYVTTIEIDYKTLLEKYPAYLAAMYGLNRIKESDVLYLVGKGELSFHTVPPEYLSHVTNLKSNIW